MSGKRRGNGEGSVYVRKDGRWCATATDTNGKRVTFYGKTQREALDKRTAAADRLADGAPVVDSRTAFSVYASRWVTDVLPGSDRRPTTQRLYARMLRLHVTPAIGQRALGAITPAHLRTMLAGLDTLAPASKRTCYAVTRAVFDTAVDDGLIRHNPLAKVTRPSVPHAEAEHLSPEQVRRFLTAAAGDRLECLWLLLALTGMRKGEALALRWSDWDESTSTLRIRRTLVDGGREYVEHEPKTTRSRRTLDVPEALAVALRAHRARQAADRLRAGPSWADDVGRLLTTTKGTALDPRWCNRAFRPLAKQAGVEGATPHTLRHSLASALLAAGTPVQVVSDQLGHSSSVVTLTTYSHVLPGARKAAADLAASLLAGEVG